MQDRPDAQELIEAVTGFLQKELVPTITDPRMRFRTLVAANVLSIVARELRAGSEPLRAEWSSLTRLLGQTGDPPQDDRALHDAVMALNQEWCARIRAGLVDDEPAYSAAVDQAEATVREKLQVANPRYLERFR